MIFKEAPTDFKKKFDIVGCYLLNDDEFLLLKRHPGDLLGNKWGPPAGKAEKNEDLKEAIIRELKEETGLTFGQNEIHSFGSLFVRHLGYDFEWHIFSSLLATKPNIILNPDEHTAFKWVTYDEAQAMDLIEDQADSNRFFFGRN